MSRLIGVFAGHTCNLVGDTVLHLIYFINGCAENSTAIFLEGIRVVSPVGRFALVFGVGRFALIRWVVSPVSRFALGRFAPIYYKPIRTYR